MAIETKEITFEQEIEYSLIDPADISKGIPVTIIVNLP